jgi:hypothetical protein
MLQFGSLGSNVAQKNRKKKPANRGDGWEPKLVCDEALECGRSVSQC